MLKQLKENTNKLRTETDEYNKKVNTKYKNRIQQRIM